MFLFEKVKILNYFGLMCYDVQAQLETQLLRAERDGDVHAIYELRERLAEFTDLPLHHSKGYTHPDLFIYTDEDPYFPKVSTWGLVPSHSEDKESIWNKTLNARGETIFKLPSFRDSAKAKRCIVHVDGFYEHHHYKGKTYPFFIKRSDGKPITLAGLWSEWTDPDSGGKWNTFAIVTTKANSLMAILHNNPKAKEPRMPVILPDGHENDWLVPYDADIWEDQKTALKELIKSFPSEELVCHTVNRLSGKEYIGNVPEITEELEYSDFDVDYKNWK